MSSKQLNMRVKVTNDEVKKCFSFAEELYDKKAASLNQFGRRDIKRERNDYISDHVIGKVVEFGFRRFLEENFDVSFCVDLEIWDDPHIHDNGNDMSVVVINGEKRSFQFKTDIKGSRSSAKWLLVEKQKITDFDTKIYVIGILSGIPDGKEFEEDPYKFLTYDWGVSILGYALNRDLVDPITRKGWIEYRAGDRLYNPWIIKNSQGRNKILKHQEFQDELIRYVNSAPKNFNQHIGPKLDCAVNYGLPISWLKNSPKAWVNFINIIHKYSI